MAELGGGSGSGYPAALDTDTSIEYNQGEAVPTLARAECINDANDAIIKIETELGVDPAGDFATVLLRLNDVDNKAFQNFVYNGCARVFQRVDAYTLVKDTYGYGPDRWAGMATGTLVSAGVLTQSTTATPGRTGYAFHFDGVTLTGTGVIYLRYRMESKDAINFKNQTASFGCKVYHDVGSNVNYTVYINKADAADDFSAVTAISDSGALAKATATALDLQYENISMGDCSKGIEILIKVEPGAITTKDFYFTELQFELGKQATTFKYRPIEVELALCQRYYERHGGTASGFPYFGAYVPNATNGLISVPFNVSKRVIPTLTKNGTWAEVNVTGSITVTGGTKEGYLIYALAASSAYTSFYPDSTDDWISAVSEL